MPLLKMSIYYVPDFNGQATDELLIPRMLHYPQGNSTYFAKPLLTVFMLANKSSWRITADHGQAFQGINRIELWDNVHIQQQAENALALFTSHLTILTQTQIAQTQAPVILSQAGNQIRGTGLRADFKRGEVELLSKAQGYYAPNKR
jgi:lipopolysaccharide export system protein LptC